MSAARKMAEDLNTKRRILSAPSDWMGRWTATSVTSGRHGKIDEPLRDYEDTHRLTAFRVPRLGTVGSKVNFD
jgi:hypothetical protein